MFSKYYMNNNMDPENEEGRGRPLEEFPIKSPRTHFENPPVFSPSHHYNEHWDNASSFRPHDSSPNKTFNDTLYHNDSLFSGGPCSAQFPMIPHVSVQFHGEADTSEHEAQNVSVRFMSLLEKKLNSRTPVRGKLENNFAQTMEGDLTPISSHNQLHFLSMRDPSPSGARPPAQQVEQGMTTILEEKENVGKKVLKQKKRKEPVEFLVTEEMLRVRDKIILKKKAHTLYHVLQSIETAEYPVTPNRHLQCSQNKFRMAVNNWSEQIRIVSECLVDE
eukprot:GHVH01003377.1.p2 GENE.GHVH01003377.1~~GHVH01003377.1.p2  ORF type:complete len:276 (-),score=38.26 GHVH01003377.1:1990-2817(-)